MELPKTPPTLASLVGCPRSEYRVSQYFKLYSFFAIEIVMFEDKVKHEPMEEDEGKRKELDKLYMFNSVPISVVTDKCNRIWFKGVDVATALEMRDPGTSIYRRLRDGTGVIKFKDLPLTSSYSNVHPETVFLNEGILFRFVLRSNVPKAVDFTIWVAEYVLPSIRAHNKYEISEENNPLRDVNVYLQRQLEESKSQVNQLETDIKNHVAEVERYKLEIQRYKIENDLHEAEAQHQKEELDNHKAEIKYYEDQIEHHEAMIRGLITKQIADREELDRVRHQCELLKNQAETARESTLLSIKPNYVPELENKRKRGKLILINKHTEEYPYYGARVQRRNYPQKMKILKDKYPLMEEILNVDTPNGVCLFNYLFEKIPWLEREVVQHNATNSFRADKTEEEMLNAIKDVLGNPMA